MDWNLYAGIVFVCVSIGSFIYKRAQMLGIRPGSYMVVQAACFIAIMVVATLVRGDISFANPYVKLGFLCGVLGFSGAITSLHSVRRGELGTNIAVVRLSFIPTTIGAILLLGEPLTMRKGGLFVFAALAIFFFFDHYRKTDRRALSSLVPALTAAVAFGLFDLVYKVASVHGVDPLAFLIAQSGTAFLLANLYTGLREKYQINSAILKTAPLSAVMFGAACLAWLKTLEKVDVSLIAPFVQMNFILTYLLGVLFLKESVTGRKLLGIVMVVLATLILSDEVIQRLDALWALLWG